MACELQFTPPPEAPVFEPTEEEFADPLAYVAKIKPIAEKTGICKVRPPATWEPPFAINIEKFRFTPRVQRLNELEALSRVKLNFLDKLARFWELQGYRLRIPNVERKSLDLHRLHKIVQAEGGFEKICQERRWVQIAIMLGYSSSSHKGCVSSSIRTHYERILYPFDLFEAGVSLQPDKWGDITMKTCTASSSKKSSKRSRRAETNVDEIDYSANKELRKLQFFGPGPKAAVPPVKGEKEGELELGSVPSVKEENGETTVAEDNSAKDDSIKQEKDIKVEVTSETKIAPDPPTTPQKTESPKISRMSTRRSTPSKSPRVEPSPVKSPVKFPVKSPVKSPIKSPRKGMKRQIQNEPTSTSDTKEENRVLEDAGKKTLDQYICLVCRLGDKESYLLLCDECDDAYHTFCLVPHLPDVPHGDWRCPKCVAKVCNKPPAEYGFEQSKTQYSLEQFGEMADKFKMNYFKNELHTIPTQKVEQEFWRLVQSLGEDVVVEYGADIHASDNGSGFPTQGPDISESATKYANSGWNLNVLPIVEKSVLRFINVDISGMKIPWCYVGMCFSCFCWHIEDHWSYSINYLHWGEPKTWYGVSSANADKFESAMKKQAPELFEQSPDLLHHITTIMNPNILMNEGVPIVRTNQHAGEFVITFPRAYHAGFNNGYNFAEAVNFCPADWLPMGRICVDHYATLRRNCVFSHDELVCRMASKPNDLDVSMAASVCSEVMQILEQERQLRKRLLEAGVRNTKREEFELLADDHRVCVCCRTTCYISAVTCKCGVATRMACPRHADDLCSCDSSRRTLRYRYALDELSDMIAKLRQRMDSYSSWQKQVEGWLFPVSRDSEELDKPKFSELQKCLEEARIKDYTSKDEKAAFLVKRLKHVIAEADPLIRVAKDFFVHERRRTTRTRGDNMTGKLSVQEFKKFVDAIDRLPCQVSDIPQLYDLRNRIENFQAEAERQLKADRNQRDISRIEELIDFGSVQDIALPECKDLKRLLNRERWLEEVDRLLTLNTETEEESGDQNKGKYISEKKGSSSNDDDNDILPGAGDIEIKQINDLIESGESIQQHPEVVEAMERLKDLRMRGMEIEEKAKRHLSGNSVPEVVSRFLKEIENTTPGRSDPRLLYLPLVEELRKALSVAWKWCDDYKQVIEADNGRYPSLQDLEGLLDRAHRCKVLMTPSKVDKLDAHVRLAKGWLEQTSRFFLRRRSSITLLEVLLPRTPRTFDPCFFQSVFLAGRGNMKCQGKSKTNVSLSVAATAAQENCVEFLNEMNETNNECTNIYNGMVEKELAAVHRLRQVNMEKALREECGTSYCLCRQDIDDFMLQCELCRDWFHAGCISLPKVLDKASSLSRASRPMNKKSSVKSESDSDGNSHEWNDPHEAQQMRDLKYLCPQCQRGRRPQLGTIYGLLLSLQQLPVRMPEGEALQLLTERAMSWQDTVHEFLTQENNPDIRAAFITYIRVWSIEPPEELKRRLDNMELPNEETLNHVVVECMEGGTLSRTELQRRIQFRLDDTIRTTMESLLVEGDLIEVSLEETKWLWQMLQMMSQSSINSPEADDSSVASTPSCSSNGTAERKKKRVDDSQEDIQAKQPRLISNEDET